MKYEVLYTIYKPSFKEPVLTPNNMIKTKIFEGQENESMYYRCKKELARIHGVDQREILIRGIRKNYDQL